MNPQQFLKIKKTPPQKEALRLQAFLTDNEELLKDFYKEALSNELNKSICQIIEDNTDIFSVFHYESTRKIYEENNISYWFVTEIASKKLAIISSNKEIILPFDHYERAFSDDLKHMEFYLNSKKVYSYRIED